MRRSQPDRQTAGDIEIQREWHDKAKGEKTAKKGTQRKEKGERISKSKRRDKGYIFVAVVVRRMRIWKWPRLWGGGTGGRWTNLINENAVRV